MATRTSRRTRRSRRSTEPLGLVTSVVGACALLLGTAPALLQGALGMLLLGFALIGAVTHCVSAVRAGAPLWRAIIEVVLIAGITFAIVFGVIWYFTVYLASQPGIMPFTGTPSAP